MEGKPPEKKEKGLIGKLKDVAEDKEHQIEVLGTFVRLGVVVWSGFIITMNYIDIPMVKKSGNSDITFVASVFTGALATFGLTTGKNGGNPKKKGFSPFATEKKGINVEPVTTTFSREIKKTLAITATSNRI